MMMPFHDPRGLQNFNFSCDLYFRIKHSGGRKDRLLCRFALNPAFVIEPVITLTKQELDPDKIMKKPEYDPDFMIDLHFKEVCPNKCSSTQEIEKLCSSCTAAMKNTDLPYWQIIK